MCMGLVWVHGGAIVMGNSSLGGMAVPGRAPFTILSFVDVFLLSISVRGVGRQRRGFGPVKLDARVW